MKISKLSPERDLKSAGCIIYDVIGFVIVNMRQNNLIVTGKLLLQLTK